LVRRPRLRWGDRDRRRDRFGAGEKDGPGLDMTRGKARQGSIFGDYAVDIVRLRAHDSIDRPAQFPRLDGCLQPSVGTPMRDPALAPDIEITPEMIEAAIIELRSWQDSQDWREGNLVTRIFLAMCNAAPNCPQRATAPSH